MKIKFQFTVQGDKQVGVVYANLARKPNETEAEITARAVKVVAKRSGDANPKLIRSSFNCSSF